MGSMVAPKGTPRWALLLAILLSAIGLYLRLLGLDRESLWFDEIYTWRYSCLGDLATVIDRGAARDVHPPLYLVLWHRWIATAVGFFWLGSYYGDFHKQQWREAAREIREHSSKLSPSADVSAVIVKLPAYSLDYYLRPSKRNVSTLHARANADPSATCSRAKTSFVWVISPNPLPSRVLEELGSDGIELQRSFEVHGLFLWLLRR